MGIQPPIPTSMGVYTDPSQLGQQVAADNQYTMGSYGTDPKTAIAAQRAMASAYNPYYKSLLGYNDKGLKLDTTPAANAGEGVLGGLANIGNVMNYQHQRREDEQNLQGWQSMLASQNQAAQQAQDAQSAALGQQAQHIHDVYGPEAAFAFQLDPKHYGENFSKGFGQLPTQAPLHYQQSYGTGLGTNQAHLDSVTDNNAFLAQNGAPPGAANAGQLPPQAINLTEQVTGKKPVDLLDFQNRRYQLGQEKNTYQEGTVNNQTLGAQNDAKLTGTLLDNQGQVIQNKMAQLKLQLEPQIQQLTAQGKSLEISGKAQDLASKQAALELLGKVQEQMSQGKSLTPADASRLDQAMKAAKLNTDFLGDLKTIANPKAGQSVTTDRVQKATGSNGWVSLPSGKQYNPHTGEVSNGPAPTPAKASPAPAKKYDTPSKYQGTTLRAAPKAGPSPLWKLGDVLGDWVHNGGPIISPHSQSGFYGGGF